MLKKYPIFNSMKIHLSQNIIEHLASFVGAEIKQNYIEVSELHYSKKMDDESFIFIADSNIGWISGVFSNNSYHNICPHQSKIQAYQFAKLQIKVYQNMNDN